MKKKLILIGGGGHCKSCIDVIEQTDQFTIVGIVDRQEKLHQKVLGYEIIATDKDIPALLKEHDFFITIGQIKTPNKRMQIFKHIKDMGAKLPVIVSPLSYVSKYTSIGEGTIIMHHAIVNAGASVGENCIINTKAIVEHDAEIGATCHIATGGIINGGVKIKSGTFWGSSAVSRENIEVEENSIVGCNATILNNIGQKDE